MPSIMTQAIFLVAQPTRVEWRNLLVPKLGLSGATAAALAGRVPTRSSHTFVKRYLRKLTISAINHVYFRFNALLNV